MINIKQIFPLMDQVFSSKIFVKNTMGKIFINID